MQFETGKARKLSDAMIDALQLCADAVYPVCGINKSVATALLQRGMIALDKPNQHGWDDDLGCCDKNCGCLCHPRNQVEPVPDDQPHIDATVEGCPNADPKEAV